MAHKFDHIISKAAELVQLSHLSTAEDSELLPQMAVMIAQALLSQWLKRSVEIDLHLKLLDHQQHQWTISSAISPPLQELHAAREKLVQGSVASASDPVTSFKKWVESHTENSESAAMVKTNDHQDQHQENETHSPPGKPTKNTHIPVKSGQSCKTRFDDKSNQSRGIENHRRMRTRQKDTPGKYRALLQAKPIPRSKSRLCDEKDKHEVQSRRKLFNPKCTKKTFGQTSAHVMGIETGLCVPSKSCYRDSELVTRGLDRYLIVDLCDQFSNGPKHFAFSLGSSSSGISEMVDKFEGVDVKSDDIKNASRKIHEIADEDKCDFETTSILTSSEIGMENDMKPHVDKHMLPSEVGMDVHGVSREEEMPTPPEDAIGIAMPSLSGTFDMPDFISKNDMEELCHYNDVTLEDKIRGKGGTGVCQDIQHNLGNNTNDLSDDIKPGFYCPLCVEKQYLTSLKTLSSHTEPFMSQKSLLQHIRYFHSEVLHCPLCVFCCPQPSVLLKHIFRVHKVKFHKPHDKSNPISATFICLYCHNTGTVPLKKYTSYRYLKQHLEIVHLMRSEERLLLKCLFCEFAAYTTQGKVGRLASQLLKHMCEVHNKPYWLDEETEILNEVNHVVETLVMHNKDTCSGGIYIDAATTAADTCHSNTISLTSDDCLTEIKLENHAIKTETPASDMEDYSKLADGDSHEDSYKICGDTTATMTTGETESDKNLSKTGLQSQSVWLNVDKQPFERNSIQHHKKYKCHYCWLKFPGIRLRAAHMQKIHPGAKEYLCRECGVSFKSNSSLRAHAWTKHQIQLEDQAVCLCEICGKVETSITMRTHLRTHRRENKRVCDICGHEAPSLRMHRRHARSHHSDGWYLCFKCTYRCRSLKLLAQHVNKNHRGIEYKCTLCSFFAATQAKLDRHVQQKHPTGQRQHYCESCDKQFSGSKAYVNHIFSKHGRLEGGRSVQRCELCPYQVLTKARLKIHMRKHEKVLKCKICEAELENQEFLHAHTLTYHKGKAFACDLCHFTTISRCVLYRHKRQKHPARRSQSTFVTVEQSQQLRGILSSQAVDPRILMTDTAQNINDISDSDSSAQIQFTIIPNCVTSDDHGTLVENEHFFPAADTLPGDGESVVFLVSDTVSNPLSLTENIAMEITDKTGNDVMNSHSVVSSAAAMTDNAVGVLEMIADGNSLANNEASDVMQVAEGLPTLVAMDEEVLKTEPETQVLIDMYACDMCSFLSHDIEQVSEHLTREHGIAQNAVLL